MFERLIFPSQVEQEACRQLLEENWPGIRLQNFVDGENFCLEMHLNIDEPIFFRWAYTVSENPGTRILTYCYRYTLQMLGDNPPAWMMVILAELRAKWLLREDNSI